MKDNLNKTYQRTRQYWFIDGLAELAFAGMCLLLGVYFTLQATLPHETLLATLMDSSFGLILVGGSLLAKRSVEFAKSRLTYPRTGYISYPEKAGGKRWLGAVLAMVMAALVAALLAANPVSFAWMPAITGFTLAAVLLYVGYRLDLVRFYLLTAFSLILGLGLSITGIENILGLALFYTSISVGLFLSGGWTLRHYLRTTQPDTFH